MSDVIRCPSCGDPIEIEAAVATGLRQKIQAELSGAFQVKERELEAKGKVLAQREAQAADAAREVEQRVKLQVEQLSVQASAKAKIEAQRATAGELGLLKQQVEGARKERDAAQAKELELRAQREALEQKEKALDLTLARRLDEERGRLAEVAQRNAAESYELKLKERDEQAAALKRTIDELKRRSEQGSMQTQGEALETSLEELLKREFPLDLFEPVPKGIRGADLVQRVRSGVGAEAGVILWEFKHTKEWASGWLPKLRDDQRALKAEVAALVSAVLPPASAPVALIEGVWVAAQACALGLAALLRQGLLDVAGARRAAEGRGEKKDLIYGYLTGPGFKNRVEGLLDPFLKMRAELDTERRAILSIWAKREHQIQRALASVSGLHGDLVGIIGNALPEIRQLELPAPAEDLPTAS